MENTKRMERERGVNMNNKTDIKHRLKNLIKELKTDPLTIFRITAESRERLANDLENILADRERLQEENDIYKEESHKITKALDFKEGTLNPDSSVVIKSMKQALIQLQAKANKYDSLVEKIKDKIEEIRNYEDIAGEQIQARIIVADSDSLNFGRKQAHGKDISILQELLDIEK